MKFVILIHSNPQPWGHPTSAHTAEYAALPDQTKAELDQRWDAVMGPAHESGEVIHAQPMGAPEDGTVLRYGQEPSHEPYGKGEHLAGFFVVDVESRERAEELAAAFSCPGDTIELRTVWTG